MLRVFEAQTLDGLVKIPLFVLAVILIRRPVEVCYRRS